MARVGAEKFQVTGTLSIVWHVSCDRCVRVLRCRLDGPLDLVYQRGSMPTDEEVELAAGDLDIGWIQGGSLVLAGVVLARTSVSTLGLASAGEMSRAWRSRCASSSRYTAGVESPKSARASTHWKVPEASAGESSSPRLAKRRHDLSGVLSIEAHSKSEHEEKGDKQIRSERRYGKFVRRFTLGDHVDDGAVQATFENGVLKLIVKKSAPQEAPKPKTIPIG